MAKYLLRAVKQVVVLELPGKEETVEAETDAQLHIAARKFLVREFPEAGLDVDVEIKRVGAEKSVTELPADFKPRNKAGYTPPAPF